MTASAECLNWRGVGEFAGRSTRFLGQSAALDQTASAETDDDAQRL
jgi:hypothetical protein